MIVDPIVANGEHLEPVMNEEEVELEDGVLAPQDRATGMVVDPLHMIDTNEDTELDAKHMSNVFHELEGGAGEFKTLGLNEDACEIPCTPENEQSKAVSKRHVEHHKACIDADPSRIVDETSTVNYFTHFHDTGCRKASTFWHMCSCIKS